MQHVLNVVLPIGSLLYRKPSPVTRLGLLISQDHSSSIGSKNKRLRAGSDHAYLLSLLNPLFYQQ